MEKTQTETREGQELRIQLLGGFSVSVDGIAIPQERWRSRRACSLVKLLALTPAHRLHRDQVIDTLWPNSDLKAGNNNFHQTLYTARQALGPADASLLVLEKGFLSLAQAEDQALYVDLEQFEAEATQAKNAQAPQAYQDALNLYTGDLLPDDLYEEWTLPQREILRQIHWNLLLDLARLYENRQEYPQAIATLQQVLTVDKCCEEAHAGLMRLYALSGQRQQAFRQYQILRDVLSQELGVEPSQSSTQLHEAILKGSFSPILPKTRLMHNLPVQLTSFIGRVKEIETLKQVILSRQTRLVTVTGVGGTGKTRLALRAAEELLDAFPQGVWLVELAALSDPDLVPGAVASVLKLRESPDRPTLEVLVEYLRSKRVLLLLDNCEHLADSTANLVDRILRTSSQVVILVTSREILGVSGELPFLCPNLTLPAPYLERIRTKTEQLEALSSCEAVRLFAERSALASPGFAITEGNASAVVQVCRRLEGIPLAIELAAARMRVLSIEQIAERLDHAFVLLTGGRRTALPRQQSLKATIDWSFNLLSPDERTLLLRLAIFSGGWTLEAAEAVCAGAGAQSEHIMTEEVLDLLGSLVDKSLILVESDVNREPRYRMLETVRQYAHDRLLETVRDTDLRKRHLAYFLQWGEQAKTHLRATDMVVWLNRLESDLGNLRMALEWSLSGPVEQGLRLGSALYWFWHIRNHRFEGIQWLERLLEADSHGPPVQQRPTASQIARGTALIVAANMNDMNPGEYTEHALEHARIQSREGSEIFRELGEKALSLQPFVMSYAVSSEEEARDCLAMARRVGDDFYTAESLRKLTFYILDKGNLPEAITCALEHLALCKKMGDLDGEAVALSRIGLLEFIQGNAQRAIELWEASQRCLQAVGNIEISISFMGDFARPALARGDYRLAMRIGEEMLAAGQEIGSSYVVYDALGIIGWAAWALDEFEPFTRQVEQILGSEWERNLPGLRHTLLYVFGRASLSRGQYALAWHYLNQFTRIFFPERFLVIQALGILAARQNQYQRAAVIFGAIDTSINWLKNVSSPAERDEYEQALASVQAALGEREFTAAWAEGQALTVEQLKALALEVGN